MEQKEYLLKTLFDNGIECNDLQADRLLRFYEMLVEKNKVMNLTAITDFEEVVKLDTLNYSNKRALLVEDNDLNAEIGAELLEMTGLTSNGVSDLSVPFAHFAYICGNRIDNAVKSEHDG